MYNLGINSNNECGSTFSEICENIKSAGFENIMIAFKSGNAEESIQQAKEFGLKIPFVHLTNTYADDLWSVGESNDNYVESMKNEIKLCAKYGIKVAVMHASQGDPIRKIIEPSKHALECMKEIVKTAKEGDVKLALENVDRPNFDHFEFLLDNIHSKSLGFCYDVGHHHLYNPEFDILSKYGDRLIAIHLHDNLMDWKYGHDFTRDLHMLPFDGKINFEKVCQKLAKTKYNDTIMLEIHKISFSEPRKYKNMKVESFLHQAKERSIKFAEMIEKYRNK